MNRTNAARLLARTSALALMGPLMATAAVAAATVGGDTIGGATGTGFETVVVTGTKFNAEAAPAKASLNTTEPQTILTRTYIENSVSDTADYTTLLAIVPSLTGLDINGPGLSDGNVKNTLRGMPDGNFGMTYDGVPFGDTNGPTHHSESYFPASTIGSINVERGPGNAGNLGAATWGGSINMYSDVLSSDFGVKAKVMSGSWRTVLANLNVQSGDIPGLGNTKAMFNFNEVQSDGYLTGQNTVKDNELIKIESEVAPNWTLTVFANRNNLHQHVNDSNGATPSQLALNGKQYALQKGDPTAPNYYWYNYQNKITDMDYVRLRGAVTDWLSIDDQAYTYAYVNKTVTTTDVTQTGAQITAGTWNTIGTKLVNPTTGATTTYKTDIPGYTKLNAYRVWGNVLRASADFDVSGIEGQLRSGIWWEGQATERQRYYFDITKCFAAGCDPFHDAWNYADVSNKKASNDPSLYMGRYGIGYIEHSGWQQIQPFVEVELHPTDDLTVTPGFKYIDWDHTVSAPVMSGTTNPNSTFKGPGAYNGANSKFTTTRPLYFFTANYKIQPSWSTYFQFATGVYVPDISVFEQQKPNTFPAAMTTTNYQWGTVYYADDFSVDADVYYIAAKHNYSYGPCATDASQQCATDTGDATYKGIEGEASYKLDKLAPGITDGLLIFANGSVNSAKSLQQVGTSAVYMPYQLKSAPYWTAAVGLIYDYQGFRFSLIDKTVGQQYVDSPLSATGSRYVGPDGGAFYRLHAYSTVNMITAYSFGKWELSVAVNNLFDDRSVAGMKAGDSSSAPKFDAGAGSAQDWSMRSGSLDQYYFQASRSYQVSLKAHI